ncbi:MAG TPA: DinB family protein [Gemmatimonadaceae bacterium]|jgi:hypothetical protein|nr:DinB family protein [Gemmatimonadaceae bacterium]
MLTRIAFFALACSFALSTPAVAQRGAPSRPYGVRDALDDRLTVVEQQVVPAADAMPDSLFNYAPTGGAFAGVRPFGEQLKHLAAANWQLGAKALGEQPPAGTHDEMAPGTVQTPAQIRGFLRGSFECLHRAIARVDERNFMDPLDGLSGTWQRTRLGLIIDAIAHSSDHYGQIVEYLRANNIVPPASR